MTISCRVCLRISSELRLLERDIINKIETIASIEILLGGNYPSSICTECEINVNKLYNFRKVIIYNDKELRETAEMEPHRALVKEEECEELQYDRGYHQDPSEFEEDPLTEQIRDLDRVNSPATLQPPPFKTSRISRSNQIACSYCGEEFPSRIKLYKHKRQNHHPRVICNICGMVLRADNLKRHIITHKAPPAACEDCGKVCKNALSLRYHKILHRKMAFTCEFCGKMFQIQSKFTQHKKIHLGIPTKKHENCTICGKSVGRLKRHMRSHTGERPFMCECCDKGFISAYGLKVHMRQHTNERPYECEVCSLSFPQKVSLVSHIKSKHTSGDS